MAKFISPVWTEIRGSIAGTTYSRNKSGLYARNKSSVTNPNTGPQIQARTRFSNASQSWRTLTAAQRNAWIAAAPSFPYTDSLGNSQTYSGQQFFNKCNMQSLNANGGAIVTAPTAESFPNQSITSANYDISDSKLNITYNNGSAGTTIPTGYKGIVEATAAVSPGIKFFGRSKYKTIYILGAADDVATSGAVLGTGYVLIYGTPVLAQGFSVRITLVEITTGLASPVAQVAALVQA